MAYSVVRVKTATWRGDFFKETETDTDFQAYAYPELDDYLTTMEQRGWTVVNMVPAQDNSSTMPHLYITFHRAD